MLGDRWHAGRSVLTDSPSEARENRGVQAVPFPLIVSHPGEYRCSRAMAHRAGTHATGSWIWTGGGNWAEVIDSNDPDADSSLRRCTYSGRPFGNEAFVDELSRRFGRYRTRGRPRKRRSAAGVTEADQYSLFTE